MLAFAKGIGRSASTTVLDVPAGEACRAALAKPVYGSLPFLLPT
jgi:hypothetical protein